MNTAGQNKLEFHKITEMLAGRTASPAGRKMAEELVPMTEPAEIDRAQEETAAAFRRSIRHSAPAFGISVVFDDALARLAIGGSLNIHELVSLARFLKLAGRAKQYGHSSIEEGDQDILTPLFASLSPQRPLSDEIMRCIPDEEEVCDSASPALRKIRRQIATISGRVHSTLTSLAHGTYKDYLQDSLFTLRQDRYCLPVKLEYKAQVPGITHDRSSSGSTLFVEPMAVVQLNNQLAELIHEEQAEIDKILAELSAQAAGSLDEIKQTKNSLAILDFIFAKASLAYEMKATRPDLNEEGILFLKEARHPLLDQSTVVPITLELGDQYDQLVITGPNTGGKTVSLKTAGLLAMMGQAGLHIPAREHSRLPVFSNVFADIGDDQAIDQNLSTFSSHMKTLLYILQHVDEDSLVLLDELGAGTDPAEGSSLARSILEWFHARGIRTIATTHYTELKEYAYNTEGVENASCEFDVESLRPTYRLIVGIPGKSNALAIAGRLGIPQDILDHARSSMDQPARSMESLLADLEKQKKELEEKQRQLKEEEKTIAALEKKLEHTRSSIAGQKDHILSQAREQAHEMLKEAKKTSDEAIRMSRKAASGRSMSASDMEKTRTKVRESLKSVENEGTKGSGKRRKGRRKEEVAEKPKKLTTVHAGDRVHVGSMGMDGVVTEEPDSKGNVSVRIGSFNTMVTLQDLTAPVTPAPMEKPVSKMRSRYSGTSKSATVRPEINLIGQDSATAVSNLDKYLDDAYLARLESVRIVHGKGTGALRKAVADHLKTIPYVKGYHAGAYGEGDLGVTIVTFK